MNKSPTVVLWPSYWKYISRRFSRCEWCVLDERYSISKTVYNIFTEKSFQMFFFLYELLLLSSPTYIYVICRCTHILTLVPIGKKLWTFVKCVYRAMEGGRKQACRQGPPSESSDKIMNHFIRKKPNDHRNQKDGINRISAHFWSTGR